MATDMPEGWTTEHVPERDCDQWLAVIDQMIRDERVKKAGGERASVFHVDVLQALRWNLVGAHLPREDGQPVVQWWDPTTGEFSVEKEGEE